VEAFLSHLAVNQFCSVNTQKIALNALAYLYERFMGIVIDDLSFFHPPKHPADSLLFTLNRKFPLHYFFFLAHHG
jgi:hypothetical protein